MADIEKVLEGLEYCQRREDGSCIGCPGDMECWCDEAIKLLEKQKPIEPEFFMDGLVERFRCKCGAHLFHTGQSKWNYCPICGQAVKWDD